MLHKTYLWFIKYWRKYTPLIYSVFQTNNIRYMIEIIKALEAHVLAEKHRGSGKEQKRFRGPFWLRPSSPEFNFLLLSVSAAGSPKNMHSQWLQAKTIKANETFSFFRVNLSSDFPYVASNFDTCYKGCYKPAKTLMANVTEISLFWMSSPCAVYYIGLHYRW